MESKHDLDPQVSENSCDSVHRKDANIDSLTRLVTELKASVAERDGKINHLRKERDDGRFHIQKLEKERETLHSKLLYQQMRAETLENEVERITRSSCYDGSEDEIDGSKASLHIPEDDLTDAAVTITQQQTEALTENHAQSCAVSATKVTQQLRDPELNEQIKRLKQLLDLRMDQHRNHLRTFKENSDKAHGVYAEKQLVAMATVQQTLVGYLEWESHELEHAQKTDELEQAQKTDELTVALSNIVDRLQQSHEPKRIKSSRKEKTSLPLKFIVFILAPVLLSVMCYCAFFSHAQN
ncbi:predicted protein [Nematostella vectensis]|uniref:Uncharacterized protein n=1 Tax=Nematostella vectensis TaxID=45351 RepID=A7RPQ8_NEMVE|nr:predicted protein [Nematostella vectensis]|eukprot:XP_001638615.1 predicted protein [Nematostella vectensis]